eukprot:CAMPEP_0118826946 /NCGR_PEP_ID=MMETSP1162-20130426/12303_1 /TAXON_ID=33656 /ORGANISM="Phaeocystis Sp, Strain CCMP2710" /LENGTH=95 /DNA_ID=CAMNT_0006757693 /DNA_START=8 /DNA_END=291 /DNA_ORIENTATION=+
MTLVEFAWDNPLVTVIVLAALIWGVLRLLQQHLSKREHHDDAGPSVEDEPLDANNRFYSGPKQTTPAAPPAPPPDGKLNDEDSRLVQELLFMSCS